MMDDLPNNDDPNSMNIYQTTCIVWFIIHALINGASDHFSHLIGKWRMLKRVKILNGCVWNQTRFCLNYLEGSFSMILALFQMPDFFFLLL